MEASKKPVVVIVIPRGEAVRNFLYSDTLPRLSQSSRVVVCSVVTNEEILRHARPYVEEIVTIEEHPVHWWPTYLRTMIENAHDRWLWSMVARNNWELRHRRARQQGGLQHLQWLLVAGLSWLVGNRPTLELLTKVEQYWHWKLRTTRKFDELFQRIKPSIVFNGSHIHGFAGELPLRVAQRMGIHTAGFIFSWDNLTSRSRIMVPYDSWFVWHDAMKKQLLEIYPKIRPEDVHVTGTPQMDFHFKPQLVVERKELARRIGIDPTRPFILYTTGVDRHFPKEHLHVENVISQLNRIPKEKRPQLVVRNYIKGTSPEMKALSIRPMEDVVFPAMLWDMAWATPRHEDLELYCSLVHHSAMSINAASTVSLEFILKDKPVINLDFDPPTASLEPCDGFRRHIRFDHFWPVASSGASMVAQSAEDIYHMIRRGVEEPHADSEKRKSFTRAFFGTTADGRAGIRVAEKILELAKR